LLIYFILQELLLLNKSFDLVQTAVQRDPRHFSSLLVIAQERASLRLLLRCVDPPF